jgi:hypothetical protein
MGVRFVDGSRWEDGKADRFYHWTEILFTRQDVGFRHSPVARRYVSYV